MEKKTFRVSNIESDDELNELSHALNSNEQVSHIKIDKGQITFQCLDFEALMKSDTHFHKDLVFQELVDGKIQQYDFTSRELTKHYFMFKNILSMDDVYAFVAQIESLERYEDVYYDEQNRVLILKSSVKDVLSYLRAELYKLNPSMDIVEYRKPIRSQDVFQKNFMHTYIRLGLLFIVGALALITSKDASSPSMILWGITVIIFSEKIILKAWDNIKSKKFFSEEVLLCLALTFGLISKHYIETCVTAVLFQIGVPILNKILEKTLLKIDEEVDDPETGVKVSYGLLDTISLYDFAVGEVIRIFPGQLIPMKGMVMSGQSQISTYSNTSTYDLLDSNKGLVVHSGDVNVGENYIDIKVQKIYERSRIKKLMSMAGLAPVYESKLEHLSHIVSKLYSPIMLLLAIAIVIGLTVYTPSYYMTYFYVGAALVVLAGAFSADQGASLGVLAGFAKAFKEGIIVESTKGLDALNMTETIIYDRFDGVPVNEEELELFKKLSHLGKVLVIYNDGPVALENDQYIIHNDLTLEEKLNIMDQAAAPIAYIGDGFKDIQLLQKSFVGISRGGLSESQVVENSDIVLLDSELNKVYETFAIARKMRTIALLNSLLTAFSKIILFIAVVTFKTPFPIWAIIVVEIAIRSFVTYSPRLILSHKKRVKGDEISS